MFFIELTENIKTKQRGIEDLEKEKNSQYLKNMMGARVNAREDREEHDFYATHPSAIETALPMLKKYGLSKNVIEPSCGQGHISETLKSHGYNVKSYDIVNRGYEDTKVQDFLSTTTKDKGDFITNPPFNQAENFIRHSQSLMRENDKAFFFLKIQFLESIGRYELFKEFPPKAILGYSKRQWTARNGNFEKYNCNTIFYIWLVFEKGYNGVTTFDWIK